MDTFAETCERIAAWQSKLRKVRLLADYLATLGPDDLGRAVRYAAGRPFAASDARKLSIGGATLREALLKVVPWDVELVRLCYREVGDSGEAISLLLAGRTAEEPMSLAEAESLYLALHESRKTAARVALLAETFRRFRPLSLKYFIKVITGGMRIGLQQKLVEEALALATGSSLAEVRSANNKAGDLERVARAALRETLSEIGLQLFHPLDFMLAKPLDELNALGDVSDWIIEDKFDGIRSQIHFRDGQVRIYTRGLEDVTVSFPDVAATFRPFAGDGVVDGEIVGYREGRVLPFNLFQQRIARKKIPARVIEEIPAAFIAYDLLYRNGELLLDEPIEARRALLETLLSGQWGNLMLSGQRSAATFEDVERLFDEARARGNEGLVLKRQASVYESGKRSGLWQKLKKPYATLDVVITAAEQGHGRRATVLSDYTFAVRSGGQYANIGKAYSGLTDQEIRELTRLLRGLSTNRFGRVYLVQPKIVLEVAFDGIQRSSRHKSGYALRFPRIVRWRQDKTPEEVDSVERVAELYERSLQAPGEPSV